MNINTTIARHAAGLFAIGAVAALAAGCGAGPTPADSQAAGAVAGQSDVHVAAGADDEHGRTGDDDHQGEDGEGQGQDGDGQGEDGGDQGGGDETTPPTAELPDSWAGTVSTERFAPGDDTAYLAMVNMHGDWAATSMTAQQIENTEFLGGMDAQCEGDVDLDGAFSNCTFVDSYGEGATMYAQVRLVPTGFGNTGLLFGVSGEVATDLAVAPGVALGLQSIQEENLSEVTAESLEGAAIGGVMIGYRMDGDIPASVSATCEVTDGGEHGLCEVTGTPDGGGDGTWYATAQRGYGGDHYAYMVTRLPQE